MKMLDEWVLGTPASAETRSALEMGMGIPIPPIPEGALKVKCHACDMEILLGPLCAQAMEQGCKPTCLFCVLKRRVSGPLPMIPLDERPGDKSHAN